MQRGRKNEHSAAGKLVNISIGPSGLRTARTSPYTKRPLLRLLLVFLCLPRNPSWEGKNIKPEPFQRTDPFLFMSVSPARKKNLLFAVAKSKVTLPVPPQS